jgi:hypothetical protein
MTGLNPILIGAAILLAGAALGVMAMLSPKNRAAFVFAQLAIMTGIYVGFALINLDSAEHIQRSQITALLIESIVSLSFVFIGLALLNTARAWMLGALILLHGGVDLLHLILNSTYSPEWYAFACIIYDAFVGVTAIWLLTDKAAEGQ